MKLAQTLRAVVASDTSTPGGAQAQTPAPSATPQQQGGLTSTGLQTGPMATTPQPAALPTGGPGGFIQADPATNALIITASEAVYRNLRTVIDQLDARRAQVHVESMIVEVTSDKAAEFGVQWAGLSGDANSRYRVGTVTGFGTGGNNLISQAVAQVTPNGVTLPPSNGLNLAVFRQIGGQLTLGALARALETESNANILSMPNLVTLDNEEARIIIGQNVPFVTGQFTTAASGGGANVNPFQTIERKDVGLSLRVRPQISEGGLVKMAIYQETSTVSTATNASDIITNKRAIETNVLVDDGQIIVLGGLIDDTVGDTNEQVPGLGDIPVIGNLFKYQKRSRVKRNLMVFLRPTVIRGTEQSVTLTGDRYGYIRDAQLNGVPEPALMLPNYGATVLPQMQGGQLIDGPLYNPNNPNNPGIRAPGVQPPGTPAQAVPQAVPQPPAMQPPGVQPAPPPQPTPQ
jgi:general secretion pathway protein D